MPLDITTKEINSHPTTGTSIQSKWWNAKEDDAYNHVMAVAKAINDNLNSKKLEHAKFARLYSNKDYQYSYPQNQQTNQLPNNRVTLNVVKQCIDTACAKISKDKPRPFILTDEGDYQLQHKAKLLNKYIEGTFSQIKAYEIAQLIFRDACVFGTGAIRIYTEDNQIQLERVIIDEILVDSNEAKYQSPRQLHRKKFADRDQLIAMFPEFESEILSANPVNQEQKSSADEILVIESWHLPSSKESKDGKHFIVIENATLFAEDYSKDYFPFVFLQWTQPLSGFYGLGLAEELSPIQLEINKILRNIQMAQHLMAVPRIFVERSSKLDGAQFNNDIGAIIKFTGTKPIQEIGQAMSQEIYQHLERLYNKAFQVTGISLLSASAEKPKGLDSGVAIREFQDIESERFSLVSQRYEQLFLNLSNIIIDVSRDLYETNKKLSVKSQSGNFIKTIPWKDVNIEDDKFKLDSYPINYLPKTPAGKLQSIQELMQAGLIDQDAGRSLLDFPDLGDWFSLANAPLEDIKFCLNSIINDHTYMAPEPFMNLQLALKLSQSTYLKLKNTNISEEKLDNLRTFMNDCSALLNPTPVAPSATDQNTSQSPQLPSEAPPPQPEQPPQLPPQG